jgi:FAD:protein FMN transferase
MNEGNPDRRAGPSRRQFVALGIGAFLVASVPWAARRREVLVRRTVPVMGTVAEIAVVHRDSRYAQAAIDAAIAELHYVDRRMSRFRPDSDVGRANRGTAREPVAVCAATAEVLREALRWAEASEGRFDPCLARAMELWNVGERRVPVPDEDASRFAGRRLYRQLDVEERLGGHLVILDGDEVGIDLGGIGKGFAVDRAVDALREWGIARALVNAGGDLYALGRAPDDGPWSVGIRSPNDPTRLSAQLEIENRAVATSGDYQQFFAHHGRRYHHLLDPVTGEPRETAHRSVTISANTCTAADAGATAVFGCDPSSAARLLKRGTGQGEVVHLI